MSGLVSFIFGTITSVIKKLALPAIMILAAIMGWNYFQNKREQKTFTLSFFNVDGLSKGAPVMMHGANVGKVIKISPLSNSNAVAVKVLITQPDFRVPGFGTEARIVNSIETGGGKIVDLLRVQRSLKGEKIRYKTVSALSFKHASKVMFDLAQLTKDFSSDILRQLEKNKKKDDTSADLGNAITNVVSSVEYGTIKKDVSNQIQSLNRKIRDSESNPNGDFRQKQNMKYRIESLKNTLRTFNPVSDAYID